MVPWFEFYLPWNAMHEPFALVLLEAGLWFVLHQGVGAVLAVTHGVFGGGGEAGAEAALVRSWGHWNAGLAVQ